MLQGVCGFQPQLIGSEIPLPHASLSGSQACVLEVVVLFSERPSGEGYFQSFLQRLAALRCAEPMAVVYHQERSLPAVAAQFIAARNSDPSVMGPMNNNGRVVEQAREPKWRKAGHINTIGVLPLSKFMATAPPREDATITSGRQSSYASRASCTGRRNDQSLSLGFTTLKPSERRNISFRAASQNQPCSSKTVTERLSMAVFLTRFFKFAPYLCAIRTCSFPNPNTFRDDTQLNAALRKRSSTDARYRL